MSEPKTGRKSAAPMPEERVPDTVGGLWLATIRWYLALSALAHPVWETAHLPLYTIWQSASLPALAFAVIHCSVGDVVLAGGTLMAAIVVSGDSSWPQRRFASVVGLATVLGIAATVYLERMNTQVWKNWAYGDAMPVVPWMEVGLTPLLQWALLPPAVLALARSRARLHPVSAPCRAARDGL